MLHKYVSKPRLKSGFDLIDDFIRFRRKSGLTEDGCF